MSSTAFHKILDQYRKYSFSERDKGDRFERLMQAYLQTDPLYAHDLKKVWLWSEFPSRTDFGGKDTGIDLVAYTVTGEYWAIQCKCYQDSSVIDKPALDSFLSTSSKNFQDAFEPKKVHFSNRIWISTTNHWGSNAKETIENQTPPVTRINLSDLEQAPVDWKKLAEGICGEASRTAKKELREHQTKALNDTHEYFKTADRGKLIMACGTGKTFTSLRIAEHETGGKGLVLFMVPSIALLGQTLREWSADAKEPINPVCICSDPRITRKNNKNEDGDGQSVVDLALPASTDTNHIVSQLLSFRDMKKKGMTVVFSTYQSIDVVAEAQKKLLKKSGDYGVFDLIVCDEAHRTTGVTLSGDDESAFVKVHENKTIQGKKRLYMTATPRLFSDDSKSKAEEAGAELCSMDDPQKYGEEIYRIGFGEAVEKALLSDYKVLILTLTEKDLHPALMSMVTDKNQEINADDASKLMGCINALSKQIIGDNGQIKETDPEPMKRAVAFCQNIKISKYITANFNQTTEVYLDALSKEKREQMVSVESKHIDGSMSAPERDELLGWLKADTDDERECRILTNVRCLSEGVDVPSLDAVLFLSARNSQVDVVQSVGRVMRKSPGKKYGYIIIPVVVPEKEDAAKALDNNERYKVVWTVLNALRAHDDRFNATVNKLELNKKRPNNIIVAGVGGADTSGGDDGQGGKKKPGDDIQIEKQASIYFEELQGIFYARMVQKVGDRRYWEQWAKDVAEIAQRQIERITRLIAQDGQHKQTFEEFLQGLRKNINPSIAQTEAVEMLSQHIITKPVFEALFEGYSFVKNNPISQSMQQMLDLLEAQAVEKDVLVLDKFYHSVKKRAEGVDNAEGKQRIIIELYDKFFKTAFPKMVEKLGIVYTPVEVVDFIVHSVNDVLQQEFNRTISDENIHILDPFTGTGTFITRLLQSGLIRDKDLKRKYEKEIHANEIVLLAYYIATVNIENAYHDLLKAGSDYVAFEGACLTDTFQLGESEESEDIFSKMFPHNSKRVAAQKKAPLRVIIGNPPYSIGQKSANDNAQNQSYPVLDNRIASTYSNESSAGLNKSLYDAYVKAFRWSSDRLDKNGGVICFVSNGSWIDGNATAGFRKCIEKEFSSIYVFNLRGNCRLSGELRRKEAGNVFGLGSRTPISITMLVKNPQSKAEKATIHYHDIGDYLNREEKLDIISKLSSVINKDIPWQTLQPNEHSDWLNQRNSAFEQYIPLFDENKGNINGFYSLKGPGISTGRDSWVYNFSDYNLKLNMSTMIGFYNEQVRDYLSKKSGSSQVQDFITNDHSLIKWTVNLLSDAEKGIKHKYIDNTSRSSSYRPFVKNRIFLDKSFIERPGLSSSFFPTETSENYVICSSGIGSSKDFTTLIASHPVCYDFLEKTQCFPLYYYEEKDNAQANLFFEAGKKEYVRRDGITDFILTRAQKAYGKKVTKEDIFYYVYGVLHSPDYRTTFSSDLKKMLPRLPLVDEPADFWAFIKAGRALAELHLNYESVPAYQGVKVTGDDAGNYHVEKMRLPKKGEQDTIIYNGNITISGIPSKAYEYVVNGKSAIDWIIERYQISVDAKSGIKNDPNDWAKEVDNPRYILDLLLSIINVSVQTVDIVASLPKMKF